MGSIAKDRKNGRVAVIGASPGGVAAALAAIHRDYDVTLYERSAEVKAAGNILNLWPPPEKVLKIIGVDTTDLGALSQWSKGRVTLVGDAAHPTSPYAAYGAGMSIEDGYFLARELAAVNLRDTDVVGRALQAYEDRRTPHTAYVTQAALRRRTGSAVPPASRPCRSGPSSSRFTGCFRKVDPMLFYSTSGSMRSALLWRIPAGA